MHKGKGRRLSIENNGVYSTPVHRLSPTSSRLTSGLRLGHTSRALLQQGEIKVAVPPRSSDEFYRSEVWRCPELNRGA